VEQEAGPKPEQKTDTEGQEALEVQMTSNGILRRALFKESAEKLTDNPMVHYHLGMVYYKIGDPNLAKGALQRALQLRRDFPGAEEAQQVLTQIS
jgi:hypothetical protein